MGNSTGCCTDSEVAYDKDVIKSDSGQYILEKTTWTDEQRQAYYYGNTGNANLIGHRHMQGSNQDHSTPAVQGGGYKSPPGHSNALRRLLDTDESSAMADLNRHYGDSRTDNRQVKDIDNNYEFTPISSPIVGIDVDRFGKRSLELVLNDISLVKGRHS